MAKLERTYNIPLRQGFVKVPQHRRSKRAISELKQFLSKHMKSEEIKIGPVLNEHIWQDGIRKPPHHVLVDAIKDDDGIVRAELSGHKYVDFKAQEKTEDKGSLKDKLTSKLGGKEADVKESEAEKPAEVPAKETKPTEAPKKDVKPTEKPAETKPAPKTPESKPSAKPAAK